MNQLWLTYLIKKSRKNSLFNSLITLIKSLKSRYKIKRRLKDMKNIWMTFHIKMNVPKLKKWISIKFAKGKYCKLLESKQILLMNFWWLCIPIWLNTKRQPRSTLTKWMMTNRKITLKKSISNLLIYWVKSVIQFLVWKEQTLMLKIFLLITENPEIKRIRMILLNCNL